ncbi:MAG: hypothetical protein J6562_00275 [Candidatus Schmidhempelia sp.]|nr:hypothetical protein [Candidatus Schmidhempelia sp.]
MRILFGIQGTGNGHISRSRTLVLALKQYGADVDCIFSGRQPEAYFDMDAFGAYRIFSGVSFATQNGRVNLTKTIQNIQAFRLIKDVTELDLSEYDRIISDFEPVSAWAAKHQLLDCIGISNQAVSHYIHPKEYGMIARTIMKYYAPVTQSVGLHWFHFGAPILPPIIEPLNKTDEDGSIVVYLPFESVAHIQLLLSSFKNYRFNCFHPNITQPSHNDNIYWQPLSRAIFTQSLSVTSGIITNTGFALISEALVLGKKILTKPVKGQFEQLYNASCLNKLALATIMPTLDINIVRQWLTQPLPTPIIYPNVAKTLAEWIINGQKEELSTLSHHLWQQVKYPYHVERKIKTLGYTL